MPKVYKIPNNIGQIQYFGKKTDVLRVQKSSMGSKGYGGDSPSGEREREVYSHRSRQLEG